MAEKADVSSLPRRRRRRTRGGGSGGQRPRRPMRVCRERWAVRNVGRGAPRIERVGLRTHLESSRFIARLPRWRRRRRPGIATAGPRAVDGCSSVLAHEDPPHVQTGTSGALPRLSTCWPTRRGYSTRSRAVVAQRGASTWWWYRGRVRPVDTQCRRGRGLQRGVRAIRAAGAVIVATSGKHDSTVRLAPARPSPQRRTASDDPCVGARVRSCSTTTTSVAFYASRTSSPRSPDRVGVCRRHGRTR